MKNEKYFDKITKIIYLIFFLIIILYVSNSFKTVGDFSGHYLFMFYFFGSLYIANFIHLFNYQSIKEKIIVSFLDLLPIIFLMITVSALEFTNLSIELYSSILPLISFFIIPLLIIPTFNMLLHVVLIRTGVLKTKK